MCIEPLNRRHHLVNGSRNGQSSCPPMASLANSHVQKQGPENASEAPAVPATRHSEHGTWPTWVSSVLKIGLSHIWLGRSSSGSSNKPSSTPSITKGTLGARLSTTCAAQHTQPGTRSPVHAARHAQPGTHSPARSARHTQPGTRSPAHAPRHAHPSTRREVLPYFPLTALPSLRPSPLVLHGAHLEASGHGT